MEYVLVAGIILFLLLLPRLLAQVRPELAARQPNPREVRALMRVRQMKMFFIHLGFYALTTPAVLLLAVVLERLESVAVIVIIWGLAVAIHGFTVFVLNSPAVRRWERRQVEALLHEDDRNT